MKFNERVLNEAFRLTDLEDEIIAYLNKNKNDIESLKITELATEFYTVPNTITRLAHKLGYTGFTDLKHSIKYETQIDDYPDEYKHLLLRNFELIDENREDKIIDQLVVAKRINFYSVGQTAYVTRIVVDNFYSVDYKSYFYTYPNELKHVIVHGQDELFVFISLSGETEQIVESAVLAKEKGHQIVSLTNLSNNSLARLADLKLYCYSPEQKIEEYNITDKTPILLIMNNLFKKYVSRLNKKIEFV